MASRVIHFEIQAEQPARAIAFYQGLFGWEITKWSGPMDYWTCSTGPSSEQGINGGLLLRQGPTPVDGQSVNAYVCTIQVDNLDRSLTRAIELGGKPAVPKMHIPGIGWLAYIKDSEGNILGMMQPDENAK